MTTRRKFTTIALATAAAALFSGCASMSSGEHGSKESMEAKVHCYGVNKCKGHNDCKTASNACKGHGSCKGKGFIGMSKSSCQHVGGSEQES